jgi:1,2-diacylglycerol 3-beta-galactosyltransferase
MKRILILTADYGYGHRSAANAIAQAMQGMYGKDCQVEIINPMDDPRTPPFLRDGENGYDKVVRENPELYKLGYRASENRLAGLLLNGSWTLMMFKYCGIIEECGCIVCLSLLLHFAVFAVEDLPYPLLTVVTDWKPYNRCGSILWRICAWCQPKPLTIWPSRPACQRKR